MSCSFVRTVSYDVICLLAQFFSRVLYRIMAQPPPVQRPLRVRAHKVLSNIQAVPEVPVAQGHNAAAQVLNAFVQRPDAVAQGPNAPVHVAAPENADAGNNQDAAILEPQLEVKQQLFSFSLSSYLYLFALYFSFSACCPVGVSSTPF